MARLENILVFGNLTDILDMIYPNIFSVVQFVPLDINQLLLRRDGSLSLSLCPEWAGWSSGTCLQ